MELTNLINMEDFVVFLTNETRGYLRKHMRIVRKHYKIIKKGSIGLTLLATVTLLAEESKKEDNEKNYQPILDIGTMILLSTIYGDKAIKKINEYIIKSNIYKIKK